MARGLQRLASGAIATEDEMAKRGRNTVDGDQSGSGVGGDDRDRQGQRIQDPASPWATGPREAAAEKRSRRRGSGLGSSAKSRRGSAVDTGTRTGRGEDRRGRATRSGSRSNKKK
jgi:hypothetical protein